LMSTSEKSEKSQTIKTLNEWVLKLNPERFSPQ